MKYLALLSLLVLGGCDVPDPAPDCHKDINERVRHEIFMQCLAAVPAGPKTTHDNPWDKVIDACENAAYYQSRGVCDPAPAAGAK